MTGAFSATMASFPYRRKWTKAELDEVFARWERLKFAMTDPVGLRGERLFVAPEMIAIQALHLSLAGCDIDEDRAFIWGERIPDEEGMWADRVVWKVKKDEPPPEPPAPMDADAAAAEAADLAGQIDRRFPPEVREALRQRLLADYTDMDRENEL